MFPNIKDTVSTDPKKPFMQFAVVLNGHLQTCNNRIAYYGSVEVLTDKPKERDILEKKIFTPQDLELLSDDLLTMVEYREDGFKMYFDDKDSIFRPWAGKIDEKREIHLWDDMLEDFYQPKENYCKFPDLKTVVPALSDNGTIDIKKVQVRNTHFRGFGISPDILSVAGKAFMGNVDNYLRMEFFHADKTKDKVDKVSAAILVTPFKSKFKTYQEALIVVPVL
jgi:hypothetical protein